MMKKITLDDFKKVSIDDQDAYEVETDYGRILVDQSPEGWILTLVNGEGHPIFPTVTTGFVVPGGMTDELREKALDKAVLIANELIERYEQQQREAENA